MAYSLEKDQWCLSVSRPAMPWLSYSLPRRFALCRGFKYESRPDPPKVQSRVIREYLNSKTPSSGHFSNYIPSTLLEELLLDDLIRRQALEEKSRRRNRMQVFWFEDSLLMAHPVGNCGTRVGLSRILPWYDMTASSVDDSSSRNDWKQAPCWQTIPKDFLEFDCGRSQLRIILHEPEYDRLLIMNDESLHVFDTECSAWDEPSWLAKILTSTPSPLAGFASLRKEQIMVLDEAGKIWKHDLVSGASVDAFEKSDTQLISAFNSNSILSASHLELSIVELRSKSPLSLFRSPAELLAIGKLTPTLIAVSSTRSLQFVDVRMPNHAVSEWRNSKYFGGQTVDLSKPFQYLNGLTWLAFTSTASGYTYTAPIEPMLSGSIPVGLQSYPNPSRLPFPLADTPEARIIGSDVIVDDDNSSMATFLQLDNSAKVRYVRSLPRAGEARACGVDEGHWNPLVTAENYVYTDEKEGDSLLSPLWGTSLIPKSAIRFDYSFIHRWIWGAIEDFSNELCQLDNTNLLLGSFVTGEIAQLLASAQRGPVCVDMEVQSLSEPARLLLSRW